MKTHSPQLTIIFDGTCGFCTRTVRLLRARDRDSQITWIPCQRFDDGEPVTGLCARAVVSITSDGVIDTGAQAFARIIAVITGSDWPVRVASLPVISALLSGGYQLIARLRTRLPGDAPWCDQHPEDCQAASRNR